MSLNVSLFRFARIILIQSCAFLCIQMFLDPADNDKRHTTGTKDQTAGFDVSVLITEVRYIIVLNFFFSSCVAYFTPLSLCLVLF